MALYTIGDLHLSLGTEKPMDVFGGGWVGYVDRLLEGFSRVTDEDTVVLCGDLSWAMGLSEAVADFDFISRLPGKKLILKGNHDYWWNTAKKLGEWFSQNGWYNISLLHNNAALYRCDGGDVALCGTRGWFNDDKDGKIYQREIIRLEASLKAGAQMGTGRIFAFLHYPPVCYGYECPEITGILTRYGVERCYYGHLHGPSISRAVEGEYGGVDYRLVSADALGFIPKKIL